jgi:hypothetical protein
MIHEAKIEFCLIAAYADGNEYCIAKFMHESDARNYKRSRKRKDYVEWKLYERRERMDGVTWTELS